MTARKTKDAPAKKHAGGRPSKFEPRYIEEAKRLALLGATDVEMAAFWGIAERTLNAWKEEKPEFSQALKDGKLEADGRVADRLYSRAMGYSHEAVKIFMPANASAPIYAPYIERYPPDVTAAIFWLKNRQRGKWRDRIEGELTGKDGAPLLDTDGVIEGVVRALVDGRKEKGK